MRVSRRKLLSAAAGMYGCHVLWGALQNISAESLGHDDPKVALTALATKLAQNLRLNYLGLRAQEELKGREEYSGRDDLLRKLLNKIHPAEGANQASLEHRLAEIISKNYAQENFIKVEAFYLSETEVYLLALAAELAKSY